MLRFIKSDKIVFGFTLGLTLLVGIWISFQSPSFEAVPGKERSPAGTAITNFTAEQIAKAEWSVSTLDFENSDPGRGRSYFDYVFSELKEDRRIYNIPYPFQKALERVNQYMGYSGAPADTATKVVLFPMGRSLQRNAALIDANQYDVNLFFRFPRVVAGVDKEPKLPSALNLKGRLYLGFHEKSKVIEAISYNDQEGRYEYQVIRDYEAGKTPKVVYANRQLCLSCHQNQTPIFSKGPWEETNAHQKIFSLVEAQLKKTFGEPACDKNNPRAFCAEIVGGVQRYRYFGAATKVDVSDPYALDTLIAKANYYHAFNKIWLSACTSQVCKQKTIRNLIKYLINGQEGLRLSPAEKINYLMALEAQFKQRFPSGMKIPDASVPNRDPLKDRVKTPSEIEDSMKRVGGNVRTNLQDLISQSSVSGEFEPLMIRAPLEMWMSTEPDLRNSNKMISGFADFFTLNDIRQIDNWLAKKEAASETPGAISLETRCKVEKFPQTEGIDYQVSCPTGLSVPLAMETGYFVVRGNKVQQGVIDNLILYGADNGIENGFAPCDRRAVQTVVNRVSGLACPAILHADVAGMLTVNSLSLQIYRATTGANARLIDGRLVSQIQIDLSSGILKVKVYNDVAFLDELFQKVPDTPFNRKFVMKSLGEGFGEPLVDADTTGKMSTLEKNLEVDSQSAEQVLTRYKNPVETFSHSCGMCHYNFEGVPPAFLGLKQTSISDLGKCQRIEICAPRMLYRLKMRNCSAEQIARFQKNPMPLPNFFKVTRVDSAVWQKEIAPQLIQFATSLVRPQELANYMVQQGVPANVAQTAVTELTTKECPNVDFTLYENFPRCEFSSLKADSQCRQILSVYGNN